MALTVGVNSWVTVVEADAYFSERWGASEWSTLTNNQKEQLLITAYRWIQAQAGYTISAAATADKVKQAQYEAAWYLYRYYESHEERRALYAQGVREFEISKFTEKLERPEFPQDIAELLEDYADSLGGSFPMFNRDLSQNG